MNAGRMMWIAIAVACGTGAASVALAQGVKVNGKEIPQALIDGVVKSQLAQGQPNSPELRNRVVELLVNQELAAQESLKKGMEKNAQVASRIEAARRQILAEAYIEDYVRANPVNDEALKKEYERVKKEKEKEYERATAEKGNKEYQLHHILVATEDDAKQIIAQIKKGGNFEKIAAEKSQDPGSKANGGFYDWAPASQYVPVFAQALTKLKKGQVSDTPVQTQFGWHVIRLDDERAERFPSLERLKPQLAQQMQQQAIAKAINDLRAKAKIE